MGVNGARLRSEAEVEVLRRAGQPAVGDLDAGNLQIR